MSQDRHAEDHAEAPIDATWTVLRRWHLHHIGRFHGEPPMPAKLQSLTDAAAEHDIRHEAEKRKGGQ